MRTKNIIILLLILIFSVCAFNLANAQNLSSRLSGKILLQVQEHGEAWYIYPDDLQRYYLGRPRDAFDIMRNLGLGISNADLSKIPTKDDSFAGDTKLRNRLKGQILLQVESHGEAWYIYPDDLKRYYLGRPSDAFAIMRKLGLGITNNDIGLIDIKEGYEIVEDWKIYRNEEYGFELKYPKDWKIVIVDWTTGREREYVRFTSPLINNKYYFALNFGARNKGDNAQISYQPDEDWELLKSLMRLGDKVKIGEVDVLTTEIVNKGKVRSILYSNRLGAGRVEISGLEIQADSGIIEGPQHLSTSDVESIDFQNLPESKLANQILSTFKFIELEEEEDVVPNTPIMRNIDTYTTPEIPYSMRWVSIGEVDETATYTLERDDSSSFSNPVTVYNGPSNSFTETLSPAETTRYYFRVKSCNKYGCSSWSSITLLVIEVVADSDVPTEPLPTPPPEYTLEPSISLIYPAGGETWIKGETYTIYWQSFGLDKVTINLINYATDGQYGIATEIPAVPGYYSWTVPSEIGPVITGGNYKIAIGYLGTNDFSDLPFSILASIPPPEEKITVDSPNGGEVWKVGNSHTIFWESTAITDGLTKVNIKLLSQQAGVPSSTYHVRSIASEVDVAKGFYRWLVPAEMKGPGISLADYPCHKIEVVDSRYGRDSSVTKVISDESDGCFSIEEICSLPETPVLTDPGASVNNGESFTLNWTSVYSAKGYWFQRGYVSPIPSDPSWYSELNSVTQTFSLGDSTTFYYRVNTCNDCGCSPWSNVVDMEVIVPSITVTSPSGGETFFQGADYTITWESMGTINNVGITICMTPESYAQSRQIETRCSQAVTVSNIGSYSDSFGAAAEVGNYTVRVEDVDDSSVYDESDSHFSIVQPSITVTSPNGGEMWTGGNIYDITWVSLGVEKITIKYADYSDRPLGINIAVCVSAPLGKYSWKIPSDFPLGDKYKIKMGECYGPAGRWLEDYSDNYFSIVPSITVTSPNGGEEWVMGKTYDITWTSTGFDNANVRISVSYGTSGYTLAQNIPITQGSWPWTIEVRQFDNPSGGEVEFSTGDNIKIRVITFLGVDPWSISDQSDNYFSITEP